MAHKITRTWSVEVLAVPDIAQMFRVAGIFALSLTRFCFAPCLFLFHGPLRVENKVFPGEWMFETTFRTKRSAFSIIIITTFCDALTHIHGLLPSFSVAHQVGDVNLRILWRAEDLKGLKKVKKLGKTPLLGNNYPKIQGSGAECGSMANKV